MLDVDLTSWILADVSLHEYLLVLDPEFLIQKIVEKVTTKKSHNCRGNLGQKKFRDKEDLEYIRTLYQTYTGTKNPLICGYFFISGKVWGKSVGI